MALEINNVIISGNLTRDVELKDVSKGRKVCTFSIANNRTFLSNNEKQNETSFIDIEVWGIIAENCAKYIKKGSPVVVTGRIKQERWQGQDGTNRSRVKIVASNVQFLSSANKQEEAQPNNDAYAQEEPEFEPSGWE